MKINLKNSSFLKIFNAKEREFFRKFNTNEEIVKYDERSLSKIRMVVGEAFQNICYTYRCFYSSTNLFRIMWIRAIFFYGLRSIKKNNVFFFSIHEFFILFFLRVY